MFSFKSHSNKAWLRLYKQAKASSVEFREHGVKRVRYKSYYEQTISGVYCDCAVRVYQHSWKTHRRTQYK